MQYVLEASPCRITAISALKRGCPITPIIQSVDAKQPSATLDLVFSRGFVLTANMTRAFKTVVMGQVIMFMTITNTSIMWVKVAERSSLPPRKMTTSHSVDVWLLWELAVEFIFLASRLLLFLAVIIATRGSRGLLGQNKFFSSETSHAWSQ